jgi:hypothetical protein
MWHRSCLNESVMRNTAWSLLPLAVLAAPLMGQFNERTMATDMTGERLIFSTTWSLLGEAYNPNSKLILYQGGKFSTLRSVLPERDPETGCPTNLPSVTRPDMSLDGHRYSYTLSWPRTETCIPPLPDTGEVRGIDGEAVHSSPGIVALSANGRWARFEHQHVFSVVNLDRGETENLGTILAFGVPKKGRQVADDGSVVIGFRSTLVYVKRVGLEREFIELPAVFDTATISDSGNTALLQTRWAVHGPNPGLWWFDIGARTAFPVATPEEGAMGPSISADGTRFAFLSAANWSGMNPDKRHQVYLMDLSTGILTQLTRGAGVSVEALISGDGRVVFARLQDGSIQKIQVETGDAEEIVPPAPEIPAIPSVFVPGSRHSISSASLAENRLAKVSIAGKEASAVSVEWTTVDFIVPSDLGLGQSELELSYEGSPFQPVRFTVALEEFAPRFRFWDTTPRIWHDSDGTAVWQASPAQSGEVIEVLLEGLGATDSEGRTQLGIGWRFSQGGIQESQPVEVLGSRKSPYAEEEGFYRVKLRVPSIGFAENGHLLCSRAGEETIAAGAPLAVTR